jgi:carbon monoxide dehydrogenase subunit G
VTTLQESIDLNVPAEAVWAQLHKMDSYPQFIEGVQSVKKRGNDQAAVQIKANGHSQKCDTEIVDGRRNEQMTFKIKSAPHLGPQELSETFGLNGSSHNGTVKQTMQQNMAKFKSLVERSHS